MHQYNFREPKYCIVFNEQREEPCDFSILGTPYCHKSLTFISKNSVCCGMARHTYRKRETFIPKYEWA